MELHSIYHLAQIYYQQDFLSTMEASIILEKSFMVVVLLQYLTKRITEHVLISVEVKWPP